MVFEKRCTFALDFKKLIINLINAKLCYTIRKLI